MDSFFRSEAKVVQTHQSNFQSPEKRKYNLSKEKVITDLSFSMKKKYSQKKKSFTTDIKSKKGIKHKENSDIIESKDRIQPLRETSLEEIFADNDQ